ncbi:hypothetical protein AGABI1DRAFT_57963 [Agaricus bisporus var. burnettii JB137-S8]|uniref:Trafficking protein particle complex subunit 2-like protein n=1 Tax=Agaricus bisporus var. burnettii (strain JB137-S8 / ATCC MYA-4627 / FGSC 10392) TaxID=597362 RepID=K5W0I7_AGABU|nr:uncharacterized protein AGABI1DRAFT_57963 [Agaricus bisporus var. burnettii JB137-S8]EKM80309.1 hypothetical protein AGABI1DRAFT_57963 [Agaricus bisporus var. burnettii JB137-S8]
MMSDSAIHAVAGAAGGVMAMTATYPLIFLSTRAAVESKKDSKSTLEVVLDIIKREGIAGLYSGLNSSLLGIAVTNGVYYYFYERTREAILRSKIKSKILSTPESMLTGLIAGSATTIASNPIWVVQTSQVVRTLSPDKPNEKTIVRKLGFFETLNNLLAKEGIGAFWRGIGPALILVINPIIQYTAFEQLKNFLLARRTSKSQVAGAAAAAAVTLTDWDFFILGALSKLVATGITYPYIVVKSRLQAGSNEYKSSLHGLLVILRQEGFFGLYKGITSKIIQSVLTAAILFASQRRIFELTKKNHPILIHPFLKQDEHAIKYHYIAHTSLDIVEERVAAAGKATDCYLGLLYTMEDVAVYSYITPLKVKIILALALTDSIVKDLDIIAIFKAMHMAYFTAISNPFLRLESDIEPSGDISPYLLAGSAKWKTFRRRVDEIARAVANYPNTLQTI